MVGFGRGGNEQFRHPGTDAVYLMVCLVGQGVVRNDRVLAGIARDGTALQRECVGRYGDAVVILVTLGDRVGERELRLVCGRVFGNAGDFACAEVHAGSA